jgi:integrase
MRSGSVIESKGKRGTVWKIRYVDADGVREQKRLGTAEEGWTRRKAEQELADVLHEVRHEGRRRREPLTFAGFAREWLATYPDAKGLKRSTREGYTTIVEKHLIPVFGTLTLDALDVRRLESYVAAKRRDGLAPRSLNRHLNLLHAILGAAIKRQLIRSNPVLAVERPREPRRRWTILSPTEIGRVARAFAELAKAETDPLEHAWLEQARVVFLTVIGAGLRRGELLGLRWKDVALADPEGATLRVRETFVRNAIEAPKSEAGERTIALARVLAAELFDHRGRSSFDGDDERVFCHPLTGGPLDHKRYAVTLRAALKRAKVDKPMRPFHDGRHTSITNAAAAGSSPAALMARAGHSDFKTTQGYIDLAGEQFREEAERLEQRVFADVAPA